MATLIKLWMKKDEILEESYRRIDETERLRKAEFEAALKVQAWFRGVRTRAYISHLKDCAIAIQRRWRGYLGRRRVRGVLKECVFKMKMNHYNAMATKIQKTWRGFYTRKYISNFYSRKRYLEGLKVKNELMLNELEEYAEQQQQLQEIKSDIAAKKKLDDFARKNHYMLSTQTQPGVYNSPYKPYPDEMEFHLRNAKMEAPHPPEKPKESTFDPGWRRYDLPRPDPLPPVGEKPQGPFRDPKEVQQQRYKPFQPTLRVETDYYSLESAREKLRNEEWVTRLIDTPFQPSKQKRYAYEPLLHSTSSFGHLPYGTSYFRHEYKDKWLFGSNQRFRTVVPPIPILEKLNDTYTEG